MRTRWPALSLQAGKLSGDGSFSPNYKDELEDAPAKVKELVKSLKAESTEFLDTTDEAVDLATEYITEKSSRTGKLR